MQSFKLAPMSPLIFWLTAFCLALPVGFAAAGAVSGQNVILALLGGVAGLLLLLYAAVFLGTRPASFDVDSQALTVRFPVWRRRIPRASILAVEAVDQAELNRRFGMLLRVGVGGLWGGFGWLWSKRSWVEFYISRTDGFVLVTREGALPLLITPDDPVAFMIALQ